MATRPHRHVTFLDKPIVICIIKLFLILGNDTFLIEIFSKKIYLLLKLGIRAENPQRYNQDIMCKLRREKFQLVIFYKNGCNILSLYLLNYWWINKIDVIGLATLLWTCRLLKFELNFKNIFFFFYLWFLAVKLVKMSVKVRLYIVVLLLKV